MRRNPTPRIVLLFGHPELDAHKFNALARQMDGWHGSPDLRPEGTKDKVKWPEEYV